MSHIRLLWLTTVIVAATALAACDAHAVQAGGSVTVPPSADMAIQDSRIFFAHQSVGGNIMDGIADLQKAGSIAPLNRIDMAAAATASGGFISDALLGKNGDPTGKTDAFVAALEGWLGKNVDVTFQKYCFVDIDATTDVPKLFRYYVDGMNRIRREFPSVTVVHVTTPLVRVQAGPRAVVKRLMGRTPDHYDDNAARETFNDLMRKEYAGKEPVFDLAALEASRPGGQPESFEFGGRRFLELLPEYTDDGAHLNVTARQRIAGEMLRFLHGVIAARPQTATR